MDSKKTNPKPKTATPAKPKPKLTPKQAEIQAKSLMRGMDNTGVQLKKAGASLAEMRSKFRGLVQALANQGPAQKAPAKSAQKPVAKPATKPATKPKAAAKPAAKAKAAAKPATKPAAKAKAPKPSKAATKAKAPVEGRPSLREAMKEVVKEHGSVPGSAELYKLVVEKYGYWSRQSLYNILKKDAEFKKGAAPAKKVDEVDSFVDRVAADVAVAQTA